MNIILFIGTIVFISNIKKFICTYIKPTLLPYPDLYDAKGIAQFIHHHTTFESLDRPFEIVSLDWFVLNNSNNFSLKLFVVQLQLYIGKKEIVLIYQLY